MSKKGMLIVISGPSGAGKGTVVNKVLEKFDCVLSKSCTTREKRSENDNYFFVSNEEFEDMINKNQFLEYAKYCSASYGTPRDYVESNLNEGKDVILEIETQGAFQVKQKCPDAVLIFLVPPSLKVLKERLIGRGTETDEKMKDRLNKAVYEIEEMSKYDYVVVNDDIDIATEEVILIIKSEKHNTKRNLDLIDIIKGDV